MSSVTLQVKGASVQNDKENLFTNSSGSEANSVRMTISIVSHGHGEMVLDLLNDLAQVRDCLFDVILTLNVPEKEIFREHMWPFPFKMIRNVCPRGFGQNQNTAFGFSKSAFFCVLNPDVRLYKGSMNALLGNFEETNIGAVGPLVLSPDLTIEDSARKFPTVLGLAKRFLTGSRRSDYIIDSSTVDVDWLAGMFVVFSRTGFLKVGGFDERFFMYLEDVDICRRIRAANLEIRLNPKVQVIHAAQRASKKNAQHLRWHLRSVLRYFFTFDHGAST